MKTIDEGLDLRVFRLAGRNRTTPQQRVLQRRREYGRDDNEDRDCDEAFREREPALASAVGHLVKSARSGARSDTFLPQLSLEKDPSGAAEKKATDCIGPYFVGNPDYFYDRRYTSRGI